MPVTKTAKRALRSSLKKAVVNKTITNGLEVMVRKAKKSKSADIIKKAISLADRAVKKHVIHRNRAARIKAQLSRFIPKTKASKKK